MPDKVANRETRTDRTPALGSMVEPKGLIRASDQKLVARTRGQSGVTALRGMLSPGRLLRLSPEAQEVVRRCWSAMAELDADSDREDVAYLESLLAGLSGRRRAKVGAGAKRTR